MKRVASLVAKGYNPQVPLQGKTCAPAAGNTISRQPAAVSSFRVSLSEASPLGAAWSEDSVR